jgi:hypothetical protein
VNRSCLGRWYVVSHPRSGQPPRGRIPRTRIADRAQSIIAHELAEHEYSGDHELALIAGPETKLPISHAARELLRQMERGWRGK